MEKSPRLFVDSNVVISSLKSNTGASFIILNKINITCYISDECQKEIEETSVEHSLSQSSLRRLLSQIKVTILATSSVETLRRYGKYVTDPDDAHVVAGAKQSKTKLLITHNIRHFQIDKIKEELGIEVVTPGHFVQSLRNS